MTKPLWQTLLKSVLETEEYEINCEECYAVLDQYADLLIEGAHPDEIMPLVKQHLNHCPDCTGLFEMLISMVQETGQNKQSSLPNLAG